MCHIKTLTLQLNLGNIRKAIFISVLLFGRILYLLTIFHWMSSTEMHKVLTAVLSLLHTVVFWHNFAVWDQLKEPLVWQAHRRSIIFAMNLRPSCQTFWVKVEQVTAAVCVCHACLRTTERTVFSLTCFSFLRKTLHLKINNINNQLVIELTTFNQTFCM